MIYLLFFFYVMNRAFAHNLSNHKRIQQLAFCKEHAAGFLEYEDNCEKNTIIAGFFEKD